MPGTDWDLKVTDQNCAGRCRLAVWVAVNRTRDRGGRFFLRWRGLCRIIIARKLEMLVDREDSWEGREGGIARLCECGSTSVKTRSGPHLMVSVSLVDKLAKFC